MSPVQHPVSGPTLSFSLEEEMRRVRGELQTAAGRVARTLVKEGSLRMTLVGVSAGGSLREHRAEGPITVQVLDGAIVFEAGGRTFPLEKGSLFALGAGIPHHVRSEKGGFFLLTVVAGDGAEKPARQ